MNISLLNSNIYLQTPIICTFLFSAGCLIDMTPEELPFERSSGNEDDPWQPDLNEASPKATVPVSDETTLIESIKVPEEGTENVQKVTAVVKDKDGNDVVSIILGTY